MARLDLTRLPQSWHEARTHANLALKMRYRAVEAIAGNNISGGPVKYANVASLWFNIVHRATFPSNIRQMLTARSKSQEDAAIFAEQYLNDEYKRQKLGLAYQRITADALIGMGICKVGICHPYEAGRLGWKMEAGKAYPYRIDEEDFAIDPMVKDDYREAQWMAHRVRVPVRLIKDDKNFSKRRKEVVPTTQQESNQDLRQPIGDIARGDGSIPDGEFLEMTDIWEFYFPQDDCVHLFWGSDLVSGATSSSGILPSLMESDWVGPDSGPYLFLGHTWLPGMARPKPPIYDILDLDQGINETYDKLITQAKMQKNVVAGKDAKEIEKYNEARQGQGVVFQNPDQVKEIATLGPNQGLYMFLMEMMKRVSWVGGNFEIAGGLSPGADTAHQSQLMDERSGGQLSAIRDGNINFIRSASESMLWYAWHNPHLTMKAKWDFPSMPDKSIPVPVHPWDYKGAGLKRTGEAPHLDIDPYSAGEMTPQRRVREMMEFLKGVVIPMGGMAHSQGYDLDFGWLTKAVSRYYDNPDIARMFNMNDKPEEGESGGADNGPRKPPETTREVMRTTPGAGRQQNQAGDMPSAASWNGSISKL